MISCISSGLVRTLWCVTSHWLGQIALWNRKLLRWERPQAGFSMNSSASHESCINCFWRPSPQWLYHSSCAYLLKIPPASSATTVEDLDAHMWTTHWNQSHAKAAYNSQHSHFPHFHVYWFPLLSVSYRIKSSSTGGRSMRGEKTSAWGCWPSSPTLRRWPVLHPLGRTSSHLRGSASWPSGSLMWGSPS